MIYFDNSATTIQKPQGVADAVAQAMGRLGNPSRSFHTPAMEASRAIYRTRREIAKLVELSDPNRVIFTSGATESLNLVVASLITAEDHVITSTLEHNSVLRPLYLAGCGISVIPCDENGQLNLTQLESLVEEKTRYLICTHGSNLLGCVTDVETLYDFCKKHSITFILDVSQTLGSIKTLASMADILCFTGHKSLMGPQGTGGIIVNGSHSFRLVKTGGSGGDTFGRHQSMEFPDILEAGTPNTHGLAGLQQGVAYLNKLGIQEVVAHEKKLRQRFFDGISAINEIQYYGISVEETADILPVVALNVGDLQAEDVALQLWEGWEIATRSGSHCTPLIHTHFGTRQRGMVRFSFGLFNTEDEIDIAISALKEIAQRGVSQ